MREIMAASEISRALVRPAPIFPASNGLRSRGVTLREIQTPVAELAEFRDSQFHARIMPDGSSFPVPTHSDSACPEPGLSALRHSCTGTTTLRVIYRTIPHSWAFRPILDEAADERGISLSYKLIEWQPVVEATEEEWSCVPSED
jgi:hypothetical protein